MAPSFKHLQEVAPATDKRSPVYATKGFLNVPYPAEEELTLFKTFTNAVAKYGNERCLGKREIDADGNAGEYTFWTYSETADRVAKLSSAMNAAGVKRGAKIGVFSINCREWMLAMQACNRMSYVCVPIYDTLGENAVEYIINHSEAEIVFTDGINLPKLEKALPKIKGFVKNIVYWGEKNDDVIQKIEGMKIKVHEFVAFMDTNTSNIISPDSPTAADLCTIMYTSGTTGDPKGVELTHKAVASSVYSLKSYTDAIAPVGPGDGFFSFLPLAHIFDRMGEEHALCCGSCIGYYQGKIVKIVDDITAFKPTIFVGVPRVFERMCSRIKLTVDESGFLKSLLFKWGYNRKAHAINEGIPHDRASPFFDALVFSKVKQRLGGRVRVILSGGAPIAPHTEEFLKVCFCSPVVQGYGLTETCAGSFVTYPDDVQMAGTVGLPLAFMNLALESVPDMNYDATSDTPKGEVLIKGPTLFNGYYKSPKQTAEAMDQDGWFHTGDIGMITPEGCLKLIDRKKNILKLSQGEYVALEKVEGAYKESTAIEQIWIYGNSFKNYLVAIVVPTLHFVQKWANEHNTPFDFDVLCKNDALTTAVKEVLDAKAKEKGLKGFEVVKRLQLESEQFSVENDLITPTFKLKRPQLQRKYQTAIDALYAE